MNNFTIKTKLMLLYICCVFLPLVLTDGVILGLLVDNDRRVQSYEMEQLALRDFEKTYFFGGG